jgi:hypothetical protein
LNNGNNFGSNELEKLIKGGSKFSKILLKGVNSKYDSID